MTVSVARYIRRNVDLSLVIAVMCLAIFGILMIYSATRDPETGSSSDLYVQQAVWMLCATIALGVTMFVPLKVFHTGAYTIYGAAILLLVIVLGLGAGRWIRWGAVGMQPSEVAKIATVLALARYLSTRGVDLERPMHVAASFALILAPMGLVRKQPDLGTALVFGAILLPMLYWAGLRPLHLFFLASPLLTGLCAFRTVSLGGVILLLAVVVYLTRPGLLITVALGLSNLIGALAVPFLWDHKLHEYQRKRILSFLNPEGDVLGSAYQSMQSKVAIGSGGLTGKGFMQGTQTKLAFLPEHHTDFIFSVVGEELGFVGAMVVLALFLYVIWRAVRIAAAARNKFASLTAVGLATILIYHVFVNIGMTVGVMPVTGVPLPFLSYGGSSLVTNMMLIGLLVNINAHRHEY